MGISKFSSQPQQMFRINEKSTGKQLTLLGYGDQTLLLSNTDTELKAFA